jgi:hypothetical protein
MTHTLLGGYPRELQLVPEYSVASPTQMKRTQISTESQKVKRTQIPLTDEWT